MADYVCHDVRRRAKRTIRMRNLATGVSMRDLCSATKHHQRQTQQP